MNRAWVSITPEFIVERLGFPKGTRLKCADMNSDFFSLRLGLEGPALPEISECDATPSVILMLRQEQAGGVRKVFGSFSHAPEKEWLLEERPIAPMFLRPGET